MSESKLQPYPDTTDAACKEVGVEAFFTIEEEETDKNTRKYIDEGAAKRVCGGCPIREQCLNWAIHHEKHGIWGGTTPREREIIRAKTGVVLYDPFAISIGYYDARI